MQASFFLICVGDSVGAGYCPGAMPTPASCQGLHDNQSVFDKGVEIPFFARFFIQIIPGF